MHPNENTLHEYVEETLDAAARSEVEQHLAACVTCRQFVDDLREIRSVAASLDPRDPPVRAWTRLERAIKLEQERHPAPAHAAARKERAVPFRWLAVAAALVLATFVGLRFKPATTTLYAPAPTVTTVAICRRTFARFSGVKNRSLADDIIATSIASASRLTICRAAATTSSVTCMDAGRTSGTSAANRSPRASKCWTAGA